MSRPSKIKPNEPCPCFTGAKFKHCCSGKVDWEAINAQGLDCRPYLSIRGRNLYFIERVCEVLQFDKLGKPKSLKEYKAAFTATAVRKIHEALMDIWPPQINIVDALKRGAGGVSGLYIGDYSFDYVTRAVLRHSIYANRILLVDPFIYPASVREEYNPIVNPEQYRTQTLKNVNLWLEFAPWIIAGVVGFIRPPTDFDPRLNWEIMTEQQKKFAESEELSKAIKDTTDELQVRHTENFKREHFWLSAPDSFLRRKIVESGVETKEDRIDAILKYIQNERDQNPNFLEPLGPNFDGQLAIITTGSSYLSAKITAGITGSYLFTDMSVRWKEIELDRESHSAENKVWSPFAKALQNTQFKYLNNLRPEHALALREEGRLESLRSFLAKVWKDAREENYFDNANAILLAEELETQVQVAEQEWKKIDTDLLKFVGQTALAVLLAAGPLITEGHASFLPAAAAVAGGVPVINSTLKRRAFPERFPASFFMRIEKGE
jgi:hypothetical protein